MGGMLEESRYYTSRATEVLDLSERIRQILVTPRRVVKVETIIEDDSGKLVHHLGFRVQHNNARGPMKGGLRYHPTVDFALTDPMHPPIRLRFGYWDNSGELELQFRVNGVDVAKVPGLSNGSFSIPLIGNWSATDRLQVIAIDETGNRQLQEKTILQLLLDWLEDPS